MKIASDIKERFWERVNIAGDDDCWHWKLGCKGGYGRINVNGKVCFAHRLAFELHNGPFDHDLCVLHKCDNPPCCNPSHLFLGTRLDNNRDRALKGRSNRFERIKHPNAKLEHSDVRAILKAWSNGATQAHLAKDYNMSVISINRVIRRATYKNVDIR